MAVRRKRVPSRKGKVFSIEEALKTGWNTAAGNISVLIPALAVLLAIGIGLGFLQVLCEVLLKMASRTSSEGKGLLTVVGACLLVLVLLLRLVLNTWTGAGFFLMTLRLGTGRETRFSDLFPPWGKVWRYFVGMILLGLVILGGILLLVVPGIVWAIQYQYVPYLMVDKGLSVGEAFDLSRKMTDGLKWKLLGYGFCLVGVAMLGMLACCVGILWAMPVAQIATASVYQKLLVQTHRTLALKKAV